MTLKSIILGQAKKPPGSQLIQASVVNCGNVNALVAATRVLDLYENKIKFFTNPQYGYSMNIDASFGGTPEHIHNGIDNVYWTASVIAGSWIFDSVDQAHTGIKSIDATGTVNNDVAQVARGSSINLSGYVAITGWIYISAWDDKDIKRIDIFGWDTGSDSIVGEPINLKDHIDIGLVGAWQKFVLLVSCMDLVGKTIDAIRFRTIDIGAGPPPDYYLDAIQIEETGAPAEFSIQASEGTQLHVNTYSIFMVDVYSTVLADATMPCLSYDKLLALAMLDNGILYQRIVSGKVTLSFPFRNLGEILMFPGTKIENLGCDGINTFLKILVNLKQPIVLSHRDRDKILFTVSDDLTGLLKLVISANCFEERI